VRRRTRAPKGWKGGTGEEAKGRAQFLGNAPPPIYDVGDVARGAGAFRLEQPHDII